MTESATGYLILGTAGHIDHGKTSLIKRLTGVDTDRLPEEKKRGITIDLGFANLELPGFRVGVVDVPGHERFVHNMVAGATGIDLAMLVVAADDSVMPQTIEHLAILELLGVRCGLVAVTKTDLVDDDHIELVEAELAELLADTFLDDAPVVPVSSQTGAGLEDLKQELARLAAAYQRPVRREVFRMPVDRVFSVQGHGTVVTGTVLSGACKVGESLQLMPQEKSVRIRGLQSHRSNLDQVQAGQRAAINLVGVKNDEVRRGDELTVGGYLEPARRLLARVRVLKNSPRPLQDRQLVRFHIGTREVTARAVLKGATIKPGETGHAEFRTREWVLADYGQRFIVRQLSPVITLGGGIVLDPAIHRTRRLRDLAGVGEKLAVAEPPGRLSAYLEENDVHKLTPTAFACRLGIDPAEHDSLLDKLVSDRTLVRLGGPKGVLMHRVRRKNLGDQILVRCQRELKRRQPSRVLERATLVNSCKRLADAEILEAMINDLLSRGRLVKVGEKIGPEGQRASLTRNQQKWQKDLIDACRQGGLSPPSIADLAKQIGQPAKEIETLARVAGEDQLLVRVADGLYLDPTALDGARLAVIEQLAQHGPATVAQLRDCWKVSRKHAVPLCEYFDAVGVTRRNGDTRSQGPNAEQAIPGAVAE